MPFFINWPKKKQTYEYVMKVFADVFCEWMVDQDCVCSLIRFKPLWPLFMGHGKSEVCVWLIVIHYENLKAKFCRKFLLL